MVERRWRYGELRRQHPGRELCLVHTSVPEWKLEERLWLGFRGCVRLTCRHELAFVTATLTNRGSAIEIPDVLVDTGAASTVINADHAADAGMRLAPGPARSVVRASR